MHLLLSVKNCDISSIQDISQLEIQTDNESASKCHLNELCEGRSVFDRSFDLAKKNPMLRVEAYSVAVNVLYGYTFHVADYYDGTRVVTCLDGDMKGYQGIGVNGIKQAESTNVEWHKKYFVHYYVEDDMDFKIISYPTSQVAEFDN